MIKNTKQNVLRVEAPKESCTDKKCPFHGEIAVKKEFFTGKIVKKDVSHSATLEWFRPTYIHKYERYDIKRSRIRVHNPPCLNAQIGQTVLVAKTRPLSKMKCHVVLKIVNSKIAVNNITEETPPNSQAQRNPKFS